MLTSLLTAQALEPLRRLSTGLLGCLARVVDALEHGGSSHDELNRILVGQMDKALGEYSFVTEDCLSCEGGSRPIETNADRCDVCDGRGRVFVS